VYLDMEIDVQPMLSLLRARAADTPDRVVLNDIGGATYGYGAFYREALRWADALERLGVGHGEAVATMLPTGADAFVLQAACGYLGAINVPISTLMRGNPLSHVLNASRTATLVTVNGCLSSNQEQLSAVTGLKRVIVADREYAGHASTPGVSIAALGRAEALAGAHATPRPDPIQAAPQSILFTSGTTGLPKPVEVSHRALTSYAAHVVDDRDHVWPRDSGYYSPWSAAHGLGFIALAVAVQRGQRLVVRDGFSQESYWSDIRNYDCQLTVALNIAGLLWDSEPRPDDGDNPLHTMIMVPLIPQFRAFGERFSVRVATVYGMTEIGPALRSQAPTTHAVAGHPSTGYEVRLVDGGGEDVAPGEAGELIVRHVDGAIASGYAHLPVETENAWRDGWFHTGDRFIASEGELRYVDRLTDTIRHRGRNISPSQIEAEVRLHPAIAECACVGYTSGGHSRYGESDQDLRLFLVVKQGRVLTVEELVDYLAPRLPPYMLPRYYDVLAEMPKGVSGRVIKPELAGRPLGPGTVERASRRPVSQSSVSGDASQTSSTV
jgi:crotonobetaine/carnitine-CoA ligase